MNMTNHLDNANNLGLKDTDFTGVDEPQVIYPSLIDVIKLRVSPAEYVTNIPDKIGEFFGRLLLPYNLNDP